MKRLLRRPAQPRQESIRKSFVTSRLPLSKVLLVSALATFWGFGTAQSVLAMSADASPPDNLEAVSPLPVSVPEPIGSELASPESSRSEPFPSESFPSESFRSEVAVSNVTKLELHLSERRLAVYRDEMLIANYSVAVGREGWQTPTGEFSVFQKQRDPAWEHPFTGAVIPPGPGNPLGTRWIGFWSDGQNSIGFHGTPDESVIGSAVSHGCVRMRNEDVLALYEQVSLDTVVTVLP